MIRVVRSGTECNCRNFGTDISIAVIVNFAEIRCYSDVLGDTLVQGIDVLPLLVQTVEKANNQATQVQLVTEGLSAACLLLKLSTCDIQAGKVKNSKFAVILFSLQSFFSIDCIVFGNRNG